MELTVPVLSKAMDATMTSLVRVVVSETACVSDDALCVGPTEPSTAIVIYGDSRDRYLVAGQTLAIVMAGEAYSTQW